MATVEGQDIVGMAIPGLPDCYKPGRDDKGFPIGTQTYPQGKRGPLFVKRSEVNAKTGETVICWRHVQGGAASLDRIANGAPLTGVGPEIGVAKK